MSNRVGQIRQHGLRMVGRQIGEQRSFGRSIDQQPLGGKLPAARPHFDQRKAAIGKCRLQAVLESLLAARRRAARPAGPATKSALTLPDWSSMSANVSAATKAFCGSCWLGRRPNATQAFGRNDGG